jgi:hypothetical protein
VACASSFSDALNATTNAFSIMHGSVDKEEYVRPIDVFNVMVIGSTRRIQSGDMKGVVNIIPTNAWYFSTASKNRRQPGRYSIALISATRKTPSWVVDVI